MFRIKDLLKKLCEHINGFDCYPTSINILLDVRLKRENKIKMVLRMPPSGNKILMESRVLSEVLPGVMKTRFQEGYGQNKSPDPYASDEGLSSVIKFIYYTFYSCANIL